MTHQLHKMATVRKNARLPFPLQGITKGKLISQSPHSLFFRARVRNLKWKLSKKPNSLPKIDFRLKLYSVTVSRLKPQADLNCIAFFSFSLFLFLFSFPSLDESLPPFIWLNIILKQMWLPSQGQFSHVICLKNGGLGFILQGGSLETHQSIRFTAFAPQMNGWCQLQCSAAQGSGHAGSTGVTPPRRGWILLKVNEILCIVQCNHCSVQQAAQHKGGESFIHIQFLSQSWALTAVLCVRKTSTEPPRMDNSAMLTLSKGSDTRGLWIYQVGSLQRRRKG